MTLYGGSRDDEIPVLVLLLADDAGEITCIECEGTGIWTVLPGDGPIGCTKCKGTGKILISI